MASEFIFLIQTILGYVAWMLCFHSYLWPKLRSMEHSKAQRAIATLHSFRRWAPRNEVASADTPADTEGENKAKFLVETRERVQSQLLPVGSRSNSLASSVSPVHSCNRAGDHTENVGHCRCRTAQSIGGNSGRADGDLTRALKLPLGRNPSCPILG